MPQSAQRPFKNADAVKLPRLKRKPGQTPRRDYNDAREKKAIRRNIKKRDF